jgi:non-ribosomal peptide synthetase component F/methionyl-tRNA formyltransferase
MILRCCIVGESELAIDCARILSEFDFSIAVVITNDVKFAQWSKQNNIQVFSNQSDIWENIRDVEYDILFSIVNPTILSEKMLASPKIMAINYHNSLLPTYAGVNSTAWAIYNNESMHGVTWHKIAKGIDTGDLIIQGELAIDANHETVQSLDARCCTMGLKIFSNLLELIKHNRYILTKQDVSKRVYYSYLDKPKSNGVISFDDKATNILRKLRALLIPNVRENRFATPKIFIEDECYIIKKAKILPINSTIPAVINAVASNSVRVSTCDFDIELLELCYLSGEPITHAILTTDLIGKKLNHPESCIEKTLANKASEYAKKESYWVNQFLSSHSNDTFLMKTCFSENSNKHIDAITMQINFEKRYNDLSSLANTFNTDTPKIILIVWLIYIYRLNSCEDYTVGLSRNDNYKSLYENKMFSSVVPLNINILADMSVESVITMLLNQLENNMLHNETFENDIFYRYPQLAGKYPNHTFSFSLYQQSDKVNKCPVQISIDEHKIIISISQSHYSGFFTKILDRVQAHFETLLCSIINNISASVCHINYMTTHEVQTLLSFNTTKQNLPTTNMVEQFTAISNKYPKKIAVISDNNQLTYDELDGISNKIAHYINNHYSKKENYVFVCFDNRMLMVIALLSILKVNKTYIPLGYQNPDSFIKNIVLDVGGDLFFVEEAYKEKFIKFIKNDTPPITLSMNEVIDYKENKKAKQDKVISPLKTTTSQQAYVMYTSGTTGVPKGVCIPQAAILRLVVNTNYVDFEKCHTVAFASDVTFDAATFEVWGALLNGSTLVCVPKNVLIDPRKLENILVEKAIDLLFLTPALFEQYALHYPTIFSLLKYLVLGGDVINLGVMNKYIKQNIKRPRHILNCYGPTENTTFTTYFEIDQTTDCLDSIPIGKPITNTNIFVLDKYYNLMPFNVPGELYASGMGLMTKYLNKYEMTKSVLDWHAIYPQKTTVKTYKTGDVVYWNNKSVSPSFKGMMLLICFPNSFHFISGIS